MIILEHFIASKSFAAVLEAFISVPVTGKYRIRKYIVVRYKNSCPVVISFRVYKVYPL
jgi:hypothetical protein